MTATPSSHRSVTLMEAPKFLSGRSVPNGVSPWRVAGAQTASAPPRAADAVRAEVSAAQRSVLAQPSGVSWYLPATERLIRRSNRSHRRPAPS